MRHYFGEGWSTDLIVPTGHLMLETEEAQAVSVSGLGDVELSGRYELGALWGVQGFAPSLAVSSGLRLPTGKQAAITPAPTVPPNILGVGAGAFAWTAEVSWTQSVSRWLALNVPVRTAVPFSENELGRTPGASFDVGLNTLWSPFDWGSLRIGVEGQALAPIDERPKGIVINSGGRWIRATGAVSVRPVDRLSLSLGARTPFWVKVNGTQLVETITVFAGAAVTFGVESHDHDDHDHGEHDHEGHDHEGHDDHDENAHHGEGSHPGDVSDLAVGGASFNLADAVVPGQVTVVDFWAEWCHPCGHIDAALRELAAEHQGLSVRRVEAPDPDSPVALEHLGGKVELPQLWFFDGKGRPITRLVGTSEPEVRELTEKLLLSVE